jgi:hypothetical protein
MRGAPSLGWVRSSTNGKTWHPDAAEVQTSAKKLFLRLLVMSKC